MKKILLISGSILFFLSTLSAQSSSSSNDDSNCYLKWAKKLEERGSDEITDGIYEDVIISFRQGARADCYSGKVEIVKGKVTQIWLKQETGNFELIEKKYKYNSQDAKVVNGLSTTLLTTDDILINIIFYKKIKAKKPGYQTAPEPTDD